MQKKFIMNHINKCIYEKELEWNGIVNNKAWSIPIILTRTVIGAKLLYECFGKEDYECIVLTSEKNLKESCVAEKVDLSIIKNRLRIWLEVL